MWQSGLKIALMLSALMFDIATAEHVRIENDDFLEYSRHQKYRRNLDQYYIWDGGYIQDSADPSKWLKCDDDKICPLGTQYAFTRSELEDLSLFDHRSQPILSNKGHDPTRSMHAFVFLIVWLSAFMLLIGSILVKFF